MNIDSLSRSFQGSHHHPVDHHLDGLGTDDASPLFSSSWLKSSRRSTAEANAFPPGPDLRDDDPSLWMTSTQFAQLLDQQEEAESHPCRNSVSAVPERVNYEKNSRKYSASGLANKANLRRNSSCASSNSSSAFSRVLTSTSHQPERFHIPSSNSSSYLDNDAKVPFGKIKQVGFIFYLFEDHVSTK